jgi:hypothetical protein
MESASKTPGDRRVVIEIPDKLRRLGQLRVGRIVGLGDRIGADASDRGLVIGDVVMIDGSVDDVRLENMKFVEVREHEVSVLSASPRFSPSEVADTLRLRRESAAAIERLRRMVS